MILFWIMIALDIGFIISLASYALISHSTKNNVVQIPKPMDDSKPADEIVKNIKNEDFNIKINGR